MIFTFDDNKLSTDLILDLNKDRQCDFQDLVTWKIIR